MNDALCKNVIIPNAASPLGAQSIHYARNGLVLFLDALRPTRNTPSIPLQTTVWEDLSNCRYDFTLSKAIRFSGKAVDLTGISGENSDFPRSNDYVVELCVKTDGRNNTNVPFFPLSHSTYGMGFGGSGGQQTTILQRADSEGSNYYAIRGIDYLWHNSLATCYFGRNHNAVYVNGRIASSYAGYLYQEANYQIGNARNAVLNDRRSYIVVAAMRIYSRELTDKEIWHNWLLDKGRYSIN